MTGTLMLLAGTIALRLAPPNDGLTVLLCFFVGLLSLLFGLLCAMDGPNRNYRLIGAIVAVVSVAFIWHPLRSIANAH